MTRLFAAACSLFLFMVGPAIAGSPLTNDQVARFVASLDTVQSMADRLQAEGKAEALKINSEPVPGETFKPYSSGVAALKKQMPAEHQKLAALLRPHGFSTEEWGGVGDRVILAYMALKMEAENPGAAAQMQAMDPKMLDMMPPQARAQMQGAMAMMQAVAEVSPADKAAVNPSKAKLDAYMERQDK